VLGTTHPVFPVTELARAISFYQAVLGFDPDGPARAATVDTADRYWLANGDSRLCLATRERPERNAMRGTRVVFAGDTAARERVRCRLTDRDVDYTERDGRLQFDDPDGNPLAVGEMSAP